VVGQQNADTANTLQLRDIAMQHGDGAGITVEENSSVFSLI